MTRWEYRTLKFEPGGWSGGKVDCLELQDHLNEAGAQGWEITGVIETTIHEGRTREVVILMKRPKE